MTKYEVRTTFGWKHSLCVVKSNAHFNFALGLIQHLHFALRHSPFNLRSINSRIASRGLLP